MSFPCKRESSVFGLFYTRFGVARLTVIAGITEYWRTINFEMSSSLQFSVYSLYKH